ncbi:uncharacterized protein CMU_004710 [Cryptosporidium muris RN66]|uniref:Uncharacterized protein n=1 Tax=Cryptosporidium muris (strain RN66) TaxID=441375 RepID=B6AK69_CRYMR|nr:uncharacterized protein CMU_004710 [Cryptosporidium muris RN66]EEA08610.1 hypothetical protein CMU_004710 [Cryptosporidium muris RN66]|eukprot:XP_002142959.1 hypothetical protein [Cryptosporidium muris RN66]
MRSTSCFLLVFSFFHFLYNINILRISIVIQRNSFLKLTAANQNPNGNDDPISQHKLELELLYGQFSKVSLLLDRKTEIWRAECEGLHLPQTIEDFCKRLLQRIKMAMEYQENLRRRISSKEDLVRNLQAANS